MKKYNLFKIILLALLAIIAIILIEKIPTKFRFVFLVIIGQAVTMTYKNNKEKPFKTIQ